MGRGRGGPRRERRIQVARLLGVTERYAVGFSGQQWAVPAGVAELHNITTDVDVLSEAAARVVVHRGDAWWLPRAVELLTEAGATQEAIEVHAAAIRNQPGGVSLAALADGLNDAMYRGDGPGHG